MREHDTRARRGADDAAASEGIAIIGMAGRFPGAPDLNALWRNLRTGVDSLTLFAPAELRAAGEAENALGDPAYVAAGRPLEGVELFDAAFFGYAPREAALLDPQQRLFLECAWTALEDAAVAPRGAGGCVGVFAGMGLSTYLLHNLAGEQGPRAAVDDLVAHLGCDKDFLATRVSFHLDLSGPSMTVQSGCSTGLLAVAEACQALLERRCDAAVAGAAAVRVPQRRGYLPTPEGILSRDGRCRPFDARASGTSFGDGVAAVVLKRLPDALAAGDPIRAVIRGAAVNNDGAAKVGYTAPSVDRQAEVIAEALAVAGVDARTVGYVEAHGTGTALGDPVEVAALARVFRAAGVQDGACLLGSVKGHLGHLDVASGLAGLVKTVLALEHAELPSTLHFERPNPACELAGSPFSVVDALRPWPRGTEPRRAGVSSLGVGGTNVHLVLEEAPERVAAPGGSGRGGPQLLLLSARTPDALAATARRLAEHLAEGPTLALADVAATLARGRTALERRRALVCDDVEEARAKLAAADFAPEEVDFERRRLAALGRAWCAGEPIDLAVLPLGRPVRLPAYPFERQRCWIDPPIARARRPSTWLYASAWRRVPAEPARAGRASRVGERMLVFADPSLQELERTLEQRGHPLVRVRPGAAFRELATGSYELDPAAPAEVDRLLTALEPGGPPRRVVHAWLARPGRLAADEALRLGFDVLHRVADAYAARGAELDLAVVTRGAYDVTGDVVDPARATALGPVRVLPQELPGVRVVQIDVASAVDAGFLAEALAHEPRGPVLALREGGWYAPAPAPIVPAAQGPNLPRGGVYLITGGFGGIGLALARYLRAAWGAKVALCGRRGAERPEARRALAELDPEGVDVLALAADVADRDALARAFAAARDRFGRLDAVIHAAGVPGRGLGATKDGMGRGRALAAKVAGTANVLVLAGDEPEVVVLCSALAAELGGLGQSDYVAGNAYLDACAEAAPSGARPRVLSIGWDTWSEVGMAAFATVPAPLRERHAQLLSEGLSTAEGVAVFEHALAAPCARVLVSKVPLGERLAERDRARPFSAPAPLEQAPAPSQNGDARALVVQAWSQILGVSTPGGDDDFFEQGGNSLLAAQLLGRLQNAYPAAEISLRRFFEEPTVAALVRATATRDDTTISPPETNAVERVRATIGAERRAALHDYLTAELDAARGSTGHELDGVEPQLLAAHLSTALSRDLGLAIYPHEIRARDGRDELVELVDGELARLAALRRAPDQPAAPAEPRPAPALAPAAAPSPAAVGDFALLLSAPRSGSTLLRLMLSAHPRLFCPPELFLLDQERMRAWDADAFVELYRDGLVRALMARNGLDYAAAQRLVDDLVARDAPVGEVYGMLASPEHRVVDKTPTYALHPATLERAERLFAAPLHVHLVRHPHATIDSFVRNRIDRIRRVDGDSYRLGEETWVTAYRNLAALRARIGAERTHVVRYEDLVRVPRETLERVCAFLGVAFDEGVLDPYGRGRMAGGPGDPHLYRRGVVDPSRGEAWRDVALPRAVGAECAELAASFGYELPT